MHINFGKGVEMDISAESIATMFTHAASYDRITYIGLKNIGTDCHASIKREDFEDEITWRNEVKAAIERTIAGLLTGETIRRNARAPKADDFTNFARKHVLSLLSKDKRKELGESADKGVAYLDAVFAKNEAKLRPIVQRTLDEAIAAAKAKAEIASELDLDI